jgi:hypothetical protein
MHYKAADHRPLPYEQSRRMSASKTPPNAVWSLGWAQCSRQPSSWEVCHRISPRTLLRLTLAGCGHPPGRPSRLRRGPTTSELPVRHFHVMALSWPSRGRPMTIGKWHRPEPVTSRRRLRPATPPRKTGFHPYPPDDPNAQHHQTLTYFLNNPHFRNKNLTPAPSGHRSLPPPLLPARLHPHRPVAPADR